MIQRYVDMPKRNVSGVLFLDKPSGFLSTSLLNKIKNWFCAKKAGHTGTLDQLATGMLPICFGEETKFAKYLLNADKRYRVLAKLGESTTTFDANGEIVQKLNIQCNEENIRKCLEFFTGKYYQIPPMFSAIKYKGLPLYKYARKGIYIARKPRIVNLYSLRYIDKISDVIELDIYCSKGTYIRSVINDIGKKLGCGAHVIGLRRLMVGQYCSISMVNLNLIKDIFYNPNLNDLEVLHTLDTFLVSIKAMKNNSIDK